MCSRHTTLSDKKLAFGKTSLSATALEYYTRYGQNRDLEKYLRVQRRSPSHSSIENSLNNIDGRKSGATSAKRGKSLDELSSKTSKPPDDDHNKSEKSKNNNHSKSASNDEGKSDNIKIKKSAVQKIKKKTKSKSYSFNTESSIEITFPPEFGVAQNRSCETVDHLRQAKMLSDSGNQTESVGEPAVDPVPSTSLAAATIVEDKELLPLPDTPRRESNVIPNMPVVDVSPTSSIASNKMRLEWDSLADIGYKLVDMNGDSSLNSYEKGALMKFFTERGLTFDDKLVIFATPDKAKASFAPIADADRKKQKHSITDKWKKAAESLPNVKGTSPATSKNLWEKALNKYKQKYGKSKSPSDSQDQSIRILSMMQPQSQSTPISITDTSGGGVRQKEMRDASYNTNFSANIKDMASQTNEIEMEAKGIQVQDDDRGIFLKFGRDGSETSMDTSRSSQGRESSAASFEFCSPGEYVRQQKRPRDVKDVFGGEAIKEVEEELGVASLQIHLEKLEISSEETNYKTSKETHEEMQNEHGQSKINLAENEKENIPPEDQDNIFPEIDKENIPPLPLPKLEDIENSPSANDVVKPSAPPRRPKVERNLSNESVLPDDLQKAVEMLNVLVSTRQIDVATKKKLMKRVVKRLLKARYANESSTQTDSTASTTASDGVDPQSSQNSKVVSRGTSNNSISGIHALSSSNETSKNDSAPGEQTNPPCEMQPEQSQQPEPVQLEDSIGDVANATSTVNDEENTNKDWLAPMTYSEIQFMNQKMLHEKQNEMRKEQKRLQDNLVNNQIVYANADQLKLTSDSQTNASGDKERMLERERIRHMNWIDQEIERLNNLKAMMDETANGSTSSHNEKLNENHRVQSQDIIYSNAMKETIGSASNSSQSIAQPNSSHSSMSTLTNRVSSGHQPNSADSFEWNSHLKMQQMVKNRTKMQTPSSDDSIQAYAREKRDQFLNKYSKTHGNNGIVVLDCPLKPQPIYTKPYSTDHYFEPRRHHMRTLSKQTLNVDAYTSITGSNGFLSSNSMSIAVAGNTSSSTTTHQYDNRTSIGVQTTDTLTKTKAIQQSHCYGQSVPTLRVNRLINNKQQQARPRPVAYVITFLEKSGQNSGVMHEQKTDSRQSVKETENHLYSRLGGGISSDVISQRVSARPNTANEGSKSSSLTATTQSDDQYTLQEYLQKMRPEFFLNAEERRKCVNELHNLRYRRNEQRKKLFVLNNSTTMLTANMNKLLPPPPLAQTRLFTSKALRACTRQKYRKLPEVRQKQYVEKQNKIRRGHRIAADLFNKNLQKRVLKGKTDLSNSMSINYL